MNRNSRVKGCMIGGAIGDAFGKPVELMSYHSILKKYGPNGIEHLELNKDGLAEITDDTQMTLFTVEALIKSHKTKSDLEAELYQAYLRWLYTQGEISSSEIIQEGDLINLKPMNIRKGPGSTCLSSLKSGIKGTLKNKINHSKGCGGVMRVAPIGLLYDKDQAFDLGCMAAAITHGHPSGYLSAGALAYIISSILEGTDPYTATNLAMEKLIEINECDECIEAMANAIDLSYLDIPPEQAISKIGEGWTGEEALSIAIYCCIKSPYDFHQAIMMAANHSGDSDTTASITGSIIGTYLGIEKIPQYLIECIELHDQIIHMAEKL
jgi:ADP-ribosylglycohydrolase